MPKDEKAVDGTDRSGALTMRRTRVYVAGAYSDDSVLGVLDNMRRGMKAGTRIWRLGFAPFVPWLDYQFQLMIDEDDRPTVEDYYEYSIAWLEASDLVCVLPNSDNSKGTQAEVARANQLGIPVVQGVAGVYEWRKEHGTHH